MTGVLTERGHGAQGQARPAGKDNVKAQEGRPRASRVASKCPEARRGAWRGLSLEPAEEPACRLPPQNRGQHAALSRQP